MTPRSARSDIVRIIETRPISKTWLARLEIVGLSPVLTATLIADDLIAPGTGEPQ
jgi:hypothetical protein